MIQILWSLASYATIFINGLNIRQLIQSGYARHKWSLMASGILFLGIFLSFYKLGTYETLTSHESYVAVPAREMLETGDWVVPRFGGLPRLQKPPLHYWIVATCYQVYGDSSEWITRFPSAISAIFLGLLIGYWSYRWYGKNVGTFALLIQLTSLYSLKFGHRAVADIFLCFLITSALYLISPAEPEGKKENSSLRWLGFYLLAGFSFLTKFHYGPAMILAPALVFFLVQRDYRSLKSLLNPAGLILLVSLVVIWPIMIYNQIPEVLNLWKNDSLIRSVQGTEPFWYYSKYILIYTLPWTPLAFGMMKESWRNAWIKKDSRERFLWIWLLVQMGILTFSATKRSHYLLPILPILSILSARKLDQIIKLLRNREFYISSRQAIAASSVVLAVSIILFWAIVRKWTHLFNPAMTLSLLLGIGSILVFYFLRRKQIYSSFFVGGMIYTGIMVIVFGYFLPGMDRRESEIQFTISIKEELPVSEKICVYKLGMNSVYYYLDSNSCRSEIRSGIQASLKEKNRIFVLTREPQIAELSRIGHCKILKKTFQGQVVARSKNAPLVLLELNSDPRVILSDEWSLSSY